MIPLLGSLAIVLGEKLINLDNGVLVLLSSETISSDDPGVLRHW